MYAWDADGTVRITSQAFSDRRYRPSVDRAKLRNYSPRLCLLAESDGVVSVITHAVRTIDTVVQNDKHGKPMQIFEIDVEAVPIVNDSALPDNPAHAEIYMKPECSDKRVFRKLCERLAQFASERVPFRSVLVWKKGKDVIMPLSRYSVQILYGILSKQKYIESGQN